MRVLDSDICILERMVESLRLVAIRVSVSLVFEGARYPVFLIMFLKDVPCAGNFSCNYMDGGVANYVQELC